MLGKGSTFRMQLPVCAATASALAKRILVVEDQEDLRAILRDFLTQDHGRAGRI